MTVIYPQENTDNRKAQQPGFVAYDLEDKKKAMAEATEEIKKELMEKWKKDYADAEIFPAKFSKINPEVIDFLLTFQNTLTYNEIAKKFNLSQDQRDALPQIVWSVVLSPGEILLEKEIEEKMKVSQDILALIVDNLNRNILLKAKELANKPFSRKIQQPVQQIKIVEILLSQALKQYRKLGEQMITANRIKIRVFPEPVRPSVKNWIDDYYENLGAGEHGSIERGNFLFHGLNTKGLSSFDRQKLGSVLKALDEKTLVKINSETEEIIFDQQENPSIVEFKIKKNSDQDSPPKTISSFGSMKFSSPQKMPSENPKKFGYSAPIGTGNTRREENINPSQANPKIKGNIVDLRN